MNNFDFAVLDFIQSNFKTAFGDFIMPIITHLGDSGIIWIILAVVLTVSKKYRPAGIAVAAALIIDLLTCNIILKPLVARIRPFEINTAIELLISPPSDFSFPSGHTAASFASTFALIFISKPYRDRKIYIPALILAVLISFSRLYLYVHFPTDIIGGIIVGLFCGFLGSIISKAIFIKNKNRIL